MASDKLRSAFYFSDGGAGLLNRLRSRSGGSAELLQPELPLGDETVVVEGGVHVAEEAARPSP